MNYFKCSCVFFNRVLIFSLFLLFYICETYVINNKDHLHHLSLLLDHQVILLGGPVAVRFG